MESITAVTAAMRYVISPLDRRLIEQLQSELAGVKKELREGRKSLTSVATKTGKHKLQSVRVKCVPQCKLLAMIRS
jgi:hypothetical protein